MADMVPGASMDPHPQQAANDREWHHHAEGATSNGETARRDPATRAGELLPAELLQPGETIILLLKPSVWFIVLAPLATLAILLAVTIGLAILGSKGLLGVTGAELSVLGMVLIGLRLMWQFLEWLSRVYVLTDRRVIRVMGVLRVQVFETRLQQIEQTELLLSLRERLFGLGTIAFATAGTAMVEAAWVMVPQPLEVHQRVVETLQRYGGNQR
jgi:hypothetical protein